MPYLDIFRLEFEKGIVIFEVNTLGVFKNKNFMRKWKSLNLGPKIPGSFWAEFKNTILIFEISTIKFVHFQTLVQKRKFSNLRLEIPYLAIFGLEF